MLVVPDVKVEKLVEPLSEALFQAVIRKIQELEGCHSIEKTQGKRVTFAEDLKPADFGEDVDLSACRNLPGIRSSAFRDGVSFLGEKPKNSLSGVAEAPEWTEIEITVDSGACDTVMPAAMCPHISIISTAKSRAGFEYEVAKGEGIPNLGRRDCIMMTEQSGLPKRIQFEIVGAHKPLLSISRITSSGYECILGKHGGRSADMQTGDIVPLHRRQSLLHEGLGQER